MPITRQKSPVFSIVSLPTDSVIVDHAVFDFINLIAVDFLNFILILILVESLKNYLKSWNISFVIYYW
jgi:hypothetical protein